MPDEQLPAQIWAAPRRRVVAVNIAGDAAARTFSNPSILCCTADGSLTVNAWGSGQLTLVGVAGDVFDFLEVKSVESGGTGTWARVY